MASRIIVGIRSKNSIYPRALSQIYIKGKSKTHQKRVFWQHVLITFQTNQKFITNTNDGLFIYLAVCISAVSKQITMAVDQSTKIQSKNRIYPRTSISDAISPHDYPLQKTLLFSMQLSTLQPAHLLIMPTVREYHHKLL